MHSRRERCAAAAALVVALACAAPSAQAQPPAAERGAEPTAMQVRKALDKLAEDPNLAAQHTERRLRWLSKPKGEQAGSWTESFESLRRWIVDLFGWIAESGRYLFWTAVALLVAGLAVYIARVVRGSGLPALPQRFVAPSHVRDLDIRPESLPDDVGAAARETFDRGEQRAALALLYRGLLSRLVHEHGVPIRASSTEGDCLALARPRVSASAASYVARLVAIRQGTAYAAAAPRAADVQALCADFAAALAAGARPP